ncbi:ribokinase [Agaribacter flavus]|uniref:Ribokinase n=1 Tax=Agaribacter flavus TaxID=1902781 RepID=A0ABV7FNK1_9ALTE
MAVFNFGSINIDYVYKVDHFVAPGETLSSTAYKAILGGKGANQSIACAKAGTRTLHIGAINSKDQHMLSPMTEAGVDMSHVKHSDDIASGHALIQVTPDAENAIILFGGANHTIELDHIDEVLQQAQTNDWVLLQNETNAISDIINKAYAKHIPVAFNPAPMTADIASLPLEKIQLLIVNEIEAMQLTNTKTENEAKLVLQQQYPNTNILLTLGKNGVIYLHAGNEQRAEAFVVDAKDTTAAGDTFIGYFLANYTNQDNVESAMRIACAASAIAVTREGAAPSIPDKDEVSTFLSNRT